MADPFLPLVIPEAPRRSAMSSNLLKYLSTAPVVATVWMVITAGILIEFNRFFPDLLLHP